MKLNVGSKNPVKVQAVEEATKNYDMLKGAQVVPVEVLSEVDDQPKSIEETIKGAMNRAKSAFKECDYSFGLESGLMKVPSAKSEYMNVSACAIFDGDEFHLGLSSAFEYPREVTRLVFEEGLDINQAFMKAGLSDNPKLGSFEGAIGLLTKGRLPRMEYEKQAVVMALVHLENSEVYRRR